MIFLDQICPNTRVSTQVNTSQHESTRINTSMTRICLFSHCFSTFSLSINYKLCSYIGKFWYIYVIAITINKKPPCFFQSLLQLYFTEFSNPPVYYDLPPVYSWPMSFSQARLPIRKKHHCSLDFCTDAPVNAIFHLEIIFK